MRHQSHARAKLVGWRSLAVGIGIGVGVSALIRWLSALMGQRLWGEEDEGVRDWRSDAWSPPLETKSADVSVPSTVAPFSSPQVPGDLGAPLPAGSVASQEATEIGQREVIRSSTPKEVRHMDEESVHNEQARQEVPSDPTVPLDIRPLVTPTDDEISQVAIEALRENPESSLDDVLSAWHVQRGVTIDAEEAERVAAIYGRLNEAYDAA